MYSFIISVDDTPSTDTSSSDVTVDDISKCQMIYGGKMGHSERTALTEGVFYILLSLFSPLHGYGIMQNISKLSQGRVDMGAGTLYGALNTMLDRGWIAQHGAFDESRKKEYLITSLGKDVVVDELERLKELIRNGQSIIEGEKL